MTGLSRFCNFCTRPCNKDIWKFHLPIAKTENRLATILWLGNLLEAQSMLAFSTSPNKLRVLSAENIHLCWLHLTHCRIQKGDIIYFRYQERSREHGEWDTTINAAQEKPLNGHNFLKHDVYFVSSINLPYQASHSIRVNRSIKNPMLFALCAMRGVSRNPFLIRSMFPTKLPNIVKQSTQN